MTAPFLEADNLFYEWKSNDLFSRKEHKVLWKIDKLQINSPGIILLAGRNGSGKSTLLRCLLGLMRPTQGCVQWFGQSTLPRGSIGYLPELPILPARVKVSEIISSLLGCSKKEFQLKEQEFPVIGSLKVSALFDRQAQMISKGQQQRLLLTLALSGHPRGFVLDEPFSGLDPWSRSELAEHLVELAHQGQFVLISSHDAPAALRNRVKETWIIENEGLSARPGCAIPE
jgi:ABC-2 type transport system ATP-binding protein